MVTPRRRRESDDFPLATVAAYGPDNTHATKLVVSILQRDDLNPPVMQTWTTDTGDVRTDETIQAEAAAFITDHRVKRTAGMDRIIGCAHEEGIDYPMGRTCPQCPFWAGIDRFTHEPIDQPLPSQSPEEVMRTLAEDAPDRLEDALESADAHRETLIPPLLATLERALSDPLGASSEDATVFSYALYLMAKWRETRAYPHVIRWLSLPEEQPFEIGGDIVTQDGGRILASVFDGNLEPIMSLIVNRQADEWGRSAGVTALMLLAAWAEVPRTQIIDRLRWCVREGLDREPNAVWDILAANIVDLEATELFADVRHAYDDDLIDPQFMEQSALDAVEAMPRGETIRKTRERYAPIDGVWKATAWWDRRSDSDNDADPDDGLQTGESGVWNEETGESVEVAKPYIRPSPKVGRNEPCPCGSGKKYKKCCGK